MDPYKDIEELQAASYAGTDEDDGVSVDDFFRELEAKEEDLHTPNADGTETTPESPFDRTLERWIVLSNASNSINRCMGLPDLYPFVISRNVGAKLAFVDELLRRQR